jgi:hypothetical protein
MLLIGTQYNGASRPGVLCGIGSRLDDDTVAVTDWLPWLRKKHRERKNALIKQMDKGWALVTEAQELFDDITTKPRRAP